MERMLAENHQRYRQRIELFKSFGYDVEYERTYIIENNKPLKGDVLEVGTGKGYFTIALARAGYGFISIDISEEEQRFARLNVKHFRLQDYVVFKIEDAQKLSFSNERFDTIFSVNTLHHFNNPLTVIDELVRVVTSSGKIIMSDFNVRGLELVARMHQSEGRVHEYGDYDFSKIIDYFRDKGFRVDRQDTCYQATIIAYH